MLNFTIFLENGFVVPIFCRNEYFGIHVRYLGFQYSKQCFKSIVKNEMEKIHSELFFKQISQYSILTYRNELIFLLCNQQLRTKVLSGFVVILKVQNFILGIMFFANAIPCVVPYVSPSIMRKSKFYPSYIKNRTFDLLLSKFSDRCSSVYVRSTSIRCNFLPGVPSERHN